MNVKHLISFETVARLRSYSKAAEVLFLTQPAVTAHITLLEKDLQTPLFVKYRTPVQMTEAGELLLTYSQKILHLIQHAETDIQKLQSGILGHITIYASESVINPLAQILKEFQAKHQQVLFTLGVHFSHDIIEKVIDGYAQIGLIKTSSPNFTHPLLTCQHLFEDEAIPIMAANHPFAKNDVIPQAMIKRLPLPLVLFGTEDFTRQIVQAFQKVQLPIEARVTLNHIPSLLAFIKSSRHLSFLPEVLAREAVANGEIISRPIDNFPILRRHAYLITKKSNSLSPLARQFQLELLAALDTT